MKRLASGVAPVSTVAVFLVSVMAVTPPVFTFVAGPRAASAVSTVTMPAAPPSAVTPPTAAPAPVTAGACAPTAMAVAVPPAATVTEAPPMNTGAPPAVAGAPSPPAVAVGAPPPPPAMGAPLSVGALPVPHLLPAVPAPHLFPPSLPAFLPVPSSPLLGCFVFARNLGMHVRFGRPFLFALNCLHSVHLAKKPQHHNTIRIRGLLTRYRASLTLRACRSCGFTTALL